MKRMDFLAEAPTTEYGRKNLDPDVFETSVYDADHVARNHEEYDRESLVIALQWLRYEIASLRALYDGEDR